MSAESRIFIFCSTIFSKHTFIIIFSLLQLFSTTDARFSLSCRVISGICQEDGMCLHEMSSRFPDCYMDTIKRSSDGKIVSFPLFAPTTKITNPEVQQQLASLHQPDSSTYNVAYEDFLEPDARGSELPNVYIEKEKRAMKLRNILMKVDRIPVG